MKDFTIKAAIGVVIGTSITFALFYGMLKEYEYNTIDQQEMSISEGVRTVE